MTLEKLASSRAEIPNFQVTNGSPCQIRGGIRLEIKCTINVMSLNHPPLPSSWKTVLQNWSLVPKRSWKSLGHFWLFCDPKDYRVRGILQARVLEWVTFPCSRGASHPRDWTQGSHITGGSFTSWATREAQEDWSR